MWDNVHTMAYKVTDRESFLTFVQALIKDREDSVAQEAVCASDPYSPEANDWENTTIERFLDGALSWATDSRMGRSQGLNGEPSWRTFAIFLIAGKTYE